MSAEELRRAAKRMRRMAEAVERYQTGWYQPKALCSRQVMTEVDSRFIAAMKPAVALALADCLDKAAEHWSNVSLEHYDLLLVAREFLKRAK